MKNISVLIVDPDKKRRNAAEVLFGVNPEVLSVTAVAQPCMARPLLRNQTFDYGIFCTDLEEESGYEFAEQLLYGGFLQAVSFLGADTEQELSFIPLGYFSGEALPAEIPVMVERFLTFRDQNKKSIHAEKKKLWNCTRIFTVHAENRKNEGLTGTLVLAATRICKRFAGWDDLLLKLDEICGMEEGTEPSPDLFPGAERGFPLDINLKIQVVSRQGESIQGVAAWLEQGLTIRFGSALSLLKFLKLTEEASEVNDGREKGYF